MEGDGMVAIVQGLKDAGLAVTLMNKTHLQNSLKINTVPISKSSVETNTNIERTGRSTAAQVRDGHYTSSYQLAHCNIRPSSPPERLPEFPPQRLEPLRNQGNFQVGGYGSGKFFSPAPSYYGSQGYRGMVWPDRGSVSGRLSPTSLPSQNTDPFVHSLRRYPLPISPERSVSSELVQRLLSYTQNKHTTKNSNARNIRLREESPTRDQKADTSTKNIQTYTRSKNEPTKNCGANTNNDIRFNFMKKGTSSPYSVRTKSNHHNDTYDYLKTSSRRARHPEVRYLNDVKKCIRDTIKQMCDDKPLVCPQIRSRYCQHKKEHHQNSSENACLENECGGQASTSTDEVPMFARCQPSTVTQPTSPSQKFCCCCMKPIPDSSSQELPSTSQVHVEPNETKEVTEATSGICTCNADGSRLDNKTAGETDADNEIANEIVKWVKTLPVYANDSPENKAKREEMVKDLADKLKSLVGDKNYEQIAKKEIMKCIGKLPMWYPEGKREQEMFKNQIANDLFNRLTGIETIDELQNVIAKWLDGIQFEKSVDKEDIAENLVYRLKLLVDKPDEMKSEIEDVLQELPIVNKNKVISKLADELTNDLMTEVSKKLPNDKRLSTDLVVEELEKLIMDWLEDTHELLTDVSENKTIVKSLAKKLKKVQMLGLDDESTQEKIKEEIVDWMDSVLKSKGEKLDSKTKIKLSNKLLDKLSKRLSKDENLQQSILNEISELVEDIPSNINENKREEIKNKVASVLAKNINNLSDKTDNIHREIENILKKEAKMPESDASDLATALINRIKGMSFSKQSKSSVSRSSEEIDAEIKQLISEEISDVLNDYNINEKKRKEIEKGITEVLADQIVRGTNDIKTKDNIMSILRDGYVSEDDALDISNRLLEKNREFSLSYRTRDSKLGISKRRLSRSQSQLMSPVERENFEEKAEREILDFMEEVTGDDNPKTRKKRKEAAEELIHRLGEIMSDPNETDKEKSIIEEVMKYLKRLLIESDVHKEEIARTLANRLQSIGFQASTPKKERSNSFYPRRESTDISAIRIESRQSDFSTSFKRPEHVITNEEKQYINELTGLIQAWIYELSIDLSATEDKGFKETMVQDLASDIIDRQKYLQLNPDAKTSNQEELDHLKYQVFRWFNKLLDTNDLSSVMQKTETLMTRIKDVKVPELVKPTEKRTESAQELIQDSINSIKDEISSWMDEIPQDLYSSTDRNFQKQMINELAEKIQQFRMNNQTENIDSEISNWLSKMLKGNKQELTKMAEALKARLKERGFTEASVMLRQDSSQLRGETLTDDSLTVNLENWVNALPIPSMNITEKKQFENLKKEFADKVRQIQHDDPENIERLKDEIRRYFLMFPLEEKMKQNDKFINDKVEQLFNLLAIRGETVLEHGSDKFVKKAVTNWLKLLPLQEGKTVNDISANAIDDLVSAISNLLVKTDIIHINDIKKTLENETEKFLKSVPLDPNVNIDVKELADGLFRDVKEMSRKRSSTAKPPPIKKAADILFDNIESWCESLPLKANTPEEIERAKKIKQEIANNLIHKIGELNMNPEVFNDDFLYNDMLEDEIDNLLTDLSSEDIKNNQPAIKKDLMEKIKEARQKTQEEVAGQAYKQQLREAISKTLPSQSLTDEEQVSFEVLKDSLADAFINLHYVGGDEELKKKYKTKINDEVNKFCNDYLKKHPASPIDSKKLNQDLYNALKGVPIPKEETVRNEVELVKIKEEVNDWAKELPLKKQTAAEQMQTNKMIAVLAKKLHDIEKLKELTPEAEYDDKIRKEITKWIKKLPVNINDADIAKLTDKLVNNLKSTEQSRRVSASTRHSIEADAFDVRASTELPKACIPICKAPCKSQYVIPPSTLSFQDREHLQMIREKSPIPRMRCPPLKDASVNALPMDAESQTEIGPWDSCLPCGRRLGKQNSGVQTHRPPEQKSMQAVGSQAEVVPHVIVKEYYWDPSDVSKIPYTPCPAPFQYPPCMTPQTPERPVSQQPSPFCQDPCPQYPRITPRSSAGPCDSQSPIPQPRHSRKEWEPNYCREMPGTPTPESGPSCRIPKARVTRLGSFDDMPRCSRSRHAWSKFPEDDEFWGEKPGLSDDGEPFLKERKEESRCRCRETVLTKCAGRKRGRGCHSRQSTEDVKKCSKCCGAHCPYPSYMYFRQ